MPRNSSGVYSLPQQPFIAGSNIIASQVNSNYSDIASTLTMSLATNGVSTMTGPIRGYAGTVAELSFTFADDPTTGWYLVGVDNIAVVINGEIIFDWTTGIFDIASGKNLSISNLTINGEGNQGFDAGVATLFAQTAAPLGWTKSVIHNNKILRVVSGTASSGGSASFATVFATVSLGASVGATTLTVSNLPSHQHLFMRTLSGGGDTITNNNTMMTSRNTPTNNDEYRIVEGNDDEMLPTLARSSSYGGGGSHTHTFSSNPVNLNVQYVDAIIVVKDA